MNILAIYGTNHGQAERVIQRITRILRGNGHEVTVLPGKQLPADLKPESFDAFVLSASIIMQRYQPYLTKWARKHRDLLNARPSVFVSINGTSPESMPEWRTAAEKYVAKFTGETGWHPARVGRFSGALRYRSYGLVTRWIMKGISRRQGGPTDTSKDYEFTDWAAVDRFARDLAKAWSTVGFSGSRVTTGPKSALRSAT